MVCNAQKYNSHWHCLLFDRFFHLPIDRGNTVMVDPIGIRVLELACDDGHRLEPGDGPRYPRLLWYVHENYCNDLCYPTDSDIPRNHLHSVSLVEPKAWTR